MKFRGACLLVSPSVENNVQLRAPHFLYHLIPCDVDDCLRYSNCIVSKSKAVFEHGPGRKLSIVPKQDLVAYSLFFFLGTLPRLLLSKFSYNL